MSLNQALPNIVFSLGPDGKYLGFVVQEAKMRILYRHLHNKRQNKYYQIVINGIQIIDIILK